MLGRIINILIMPFRAAARLSRTIFRETGKTSRTTVNAGGSMIASAAGADLLEEEDRDEPPSGVETVLFSQLPRPRLTERAAAELTLEQAVSYAEDAKAFYRDGFPIFARGDFF